MSRFKWLAIAGIFMLLTTGLTACGGDDDEGPGEASFNLVIGDLVPLTGDLSQFGPPGRKAANVASEQIRDAIREVGTDIQVRVRHADTETNPQAAVSAARKLVADGASCIAGAWGSANTIPVGRSVASRQRVPLISPASTSPEITDLDDNGFVFRTAPSDALQGQVLADAVEQELEGSAEGKTISLAGRNDAYGEGILNQFKEAWEEKGGQTTGPVLYDPEQASFSSEANRIVRGNPEGFVIIDFEDPFSKVGAALVRTGDYDASRMFTADGLAFEDFPSAIPQQSLEGARGTRPASPDDFEPAEAFNRVFREAGGPGRGTFDDRNFDAVMLCFLGAVAAGSADGAEIQEQIQEISGGEGTRYSFEQLPEAIRALQNGEDINYVGASGEIDLDDNGDPTVATYEIFEYRGGELRGLRKVDVGDQPTGDTDTETEPAGEETAE